MVNDLVIIPSKDNTEYAEMSSASVELSRRSSGALFRKHILTKGELIHPATGARIKIDDNFISKMKTNFDNKVCPIVQVPLANDSNQHVEDPDRNVGEVVDIEVKGGKVYAVIDARDPKAVEKFKNRTYIGASAMLSLDYTDTNTGKKAGPTLCHVAVTNRPYITNLEDYEEIVKASADNSEEAVLLTEPADENNETGSQEEPELKEHKTMTKEELIEALKTEHGIDVVALQTEADKPAPTSDPAAELSNKLVSTLTEMGVVKLTNDDTTSNVEQVVGAVVELAQNNVELSNRIEKLEATSLKAEAEFEVENQIRDGRIDPAKKDSMVKLYLTNKDLYNDLLPAEPMVNLSGKEVGSSVAANEDKVEVDVDAEVARLAKLV